MGKLILAVLGATAGVAAAVFIAARRESKEPAGLTSLSGATPEVLPPAETPIMPRADAPSAFDTNPTQEGATSG